MDKTKIIRNAFDHERIKKPIFLFISGSHLYGLNNERSDIDIRGVFFSDIYSWIGVTPIEQYTIELDDDNPDSVVYEYRKFIRLCYNSNPNTIEFLYLDKNHKNVILWTDEWEELRNFIRNNIVSQKAYDSFIGFAESQFKKIVIKHGNKTGRQYLVNKFGFDVKFASHSIRLLQELKELFLYGEIKFPLEENVRKKCYDIKYNKYYNSLDEFQTDFLKEKSIIETINPIIIKEPDYLSYKEHILYVFKKWISN